MGVLDASRLRPVMCWKRCCGLSIQVRNGTCCRKATRTTKLCIDAFDLVPQQNLREVLTDLANELRDKGTLDEKNASRCPPSRTRRHSAWVATLRPGSGLCHGDFDRRQTGARADLEIRQPISETHAGGRSC